MPHVHKINLNSLKEITVDYRTKWWSCTCGWLSWQTGQCLQYSWTNPRVML